jgi:hypothetical protein
LLPYGTLPFVDLKSLFTLVPPTHVTTLFIVLFKVKSVSVFSLGLQSGYSWHSFAAVTAATLLLLLLLDRHRDGNAVVKARRSNLETLTIIGPPDFRLL